MRTVAIIGVGLIGGSFALALRRAGFQGRILGVSSRTTIEIALARQAIDQGLPLEEAAPQADLVYLSQPIGQILETLRSLDSLLRPECLVTDAGSTKAVIVSQARASIHRCQFLGGHPMAGKERRGVEEAEAGLFEGRTYVLTPADPAELETAAAQAFLTWVRKIGAVPVVLSPEEHDRIVSFTSHLPQIASTGLAALLADHPEVSDKLRVAGPGLADTTRLALSAFEIWRDILATNTARIEEALAAYIAKLELLRSQLRDDRMRQEFEAAAEFAGRLRQRDTEREK